MIDKYLENLSKLVGIDKNTLEKMYLDVKSHISKTLKNKKDVISKLADADIDDIALSELVDKLNVNNIDLPEVNHVVIQNLLKAIRATDTTGRYFKLTNSYNSVGITPRIIQSDKVATFSITGKGEIFYNPNFAKSIYILSKIKEIKPPKYLYYYKSNGGFIDDAFIGVDFILRHELEHYVNADHFYLEDFIDKKIDEYIKEKGLDPKIKNKLERLYQRASNIAGDLILNSFLLELLPAPTGNMLYPKSKDIIKGKYGGYIGLTDYIFRDLVENKDDNDDGNGEGEGEPGEGEGESGDGDGESGDGESKQGEGKGKGKSGNNKKLTEEEIDKIISELDETLDKISKETKDHSEGKTGNSKLDKSMEEKKDKDLEKSGEGDDSKPTESDIANKIKNEIEKIKKGLEEGAKDKTEYSLSDANSELSEKAASDRSKQSSQVGGQGKDKDSKLNAKLDDSKINPFWQKAIKKLSSGASKVKDKDYRRLDPRSVGQATGSNLGDDTGILVKPKEFKKTVDKKNLIFIIDTSGSMGGVIDNIMSTIYKIIKTNAKDIGKVYVLKFSSKIDASVLSDNSGKPIDLSKVKGNLLAAKFKKFKSNDELVKNKPTGPVITLKRILTTGELGGTVFPKTTAKAVADLAKSTNTSIIVISDSDVIAGIDNLHSLKILLDSIKGNKVKKIGVFLVDVPKGLLERMPSLKKYKKVLYSIDSDNV